MNASLRLAALFAVFSCRPAEPPPPPGAQVAETTQSVAELEGVAWTLVWLLDQSVHITNDRPAPTLVFRGDDQSASGNTGCNEFSGKYELDGARLSFGPMVSTRRACTDPVLNQRENLLLQALSETRTWRVSDDSTLVLAGPTGQVARFERNGVSPD